MTIVQPITSPLLTGLPRITHGFFTRADGVSKGLYAGRNCGLGSKDSAQNVRTNLARCAENLGLGLHQLVCLEQVHGTQILTLAPQNVPANRPKADGMVTKAPNIGLCIATADCIALLAADEYAGVIGAAHVGWRGAFGGIVSNLIDSMVALGADICHIKVGIGPGLSQANYEVGEAFVHHFINGNAAYKTYFTASDTTENPHFDNTAFVRDKLYAAGIYPSNVSQFDICTYDAFEVFFSYRRATHRQEPDYGRQISIIAQI